MKFIRYAIRSLWVKLINDKILAFACVMGLFTWIYARPYVAFCAETDHPITWCLFPFFLTSPSYLVLFYLGVIYVNSDIPFQQSSQLYQIIRVGQRRWAAAQLIGIFLRSVALTVLTALLTLLPFIGRLKLSWKWGKVALTLASQHRIVSEFYDSWDPMLEFAYETMQTYSPLGLMALTMVIVSMICTLLGLIMYLGSITAGRAVGLTAATALCLMVYLVQNAFSAYRLGISRFVPTSWAQVAFAPERFDGFLRLPSVRYMLTCLTAGIMILGVCSLLIVTRTELNWENSDA